MMRWLTLMALAAAPLLARAEPVQSEFMAIGVEKRSTGTFYVRSEIDGFGPVDLLVDTGSSYLVITQGMLEALRAGDRAVFSRDLEGRMADGSTRIIPVYRLQRLRIGSACWVHDVEAAVFPAGSRPILGMNVLSRLAPFTLSTDPAQLRFAHCEPEIASATDS